MTKSTTPSHFCARGRAVDVATSRKRSMRTGKDDGRRGRRRRGQNKTHSSAAPRLRVALLLAKAGAPVVPLHSVKNGRCTCGASNCDSPGRHPRAKHGTRDATTKAATVRQLWQRWPKAKVGIVLGAKSKLMAVATYGRTGRQTLDVLSATRGMLPRTITIRDLNLRFRLFRGTRLERGEIGTGVKVLGDGDLIVAPSRLDDPSARHRFGSGRAPGTVEIASAPQWLTDVSEKPSSELPPRCQGRNLPLASLSSRHRTSRRRRWNGSGRASLRATGSLVW